MCIEVVTYVRLVCITASTDFDLIEMYLVLLRVIYSALLCFASSAQ